MNHSKPIRIVLLVFLAVGFFPAIAAADCSDTLINRLLDSGFAKSEILDLCGKKELPNKFQHNFRAGAAACNGLNLVKEQIERAYDNCLDYNKDRWDDWERDGRKRHGKRNPWMMPPMDLSCEHYTVNLERIEEKIDELCR